VVTPSLDGRPHNDESGKHTEARLEIADSFFVAKK
jgi:hypothetical protein